MESTPMANRYAKVHPGAGGGLVMVIPGDGDVDGDGYAWRWRGRGVGCWVFGVGGLGGSFSGGCRHNRLYRGGGSNPNQPVRLLPAATRKFL